MEFLVKCEDAAGQVLGDKKIFGARLSRKPLAGKDSLVANIGVAGIEGSSNPFELGKSYKVTITEVKK